MRSDHRGRAAGEPLIAVIGSQWPNEGDGQRRSIVLSRAGWPQRMEIARAVHPCRAVSILVTPASRQSSLRDCELELNGSPVDVTGLLNACDGRGGPAHGSRRNEAALRMASVLAPLVAHPSRLSPVFEARARGKIFLRRFLIFCAPASSQAPYMRPTLPLHAGASRLARGEAAQNMPPRRARHARSK